MKRSDTLFVAVFSASIAGLLMGPVAAEAQPCVPAPPGLVSWWPGDGDARDIQGSNDGTLQNGATFAPGFVGQAFSFDGMDGFVHVPNSPSLTLAGEFTVDFWFSPTVTFDPSNPAAPGFLSKGRSDTINLANDDGRIEVRGPIPRPNSVTNTWIAGTWYFVAVTFDSTGYQIYVNGVLQGGIASTYSILANANDIEIGSIPGFPRAGVTFYGRIDEVEIFDRALLGSEIQSLFDAGSAGKCKDQDEDGVSDDIDVCPGTVIPEAVPTHWLGRNRWALVDGDGDFDTRNPPGNGPGLSFTIDETAGCSCEQIIGALGLGNGHTKHGCSLGAMRDWTEFVATGVFPGDDDSESGSD